MKEEKKNTFVRKITWINQITRITNNKKILKFLTPPLNLFDQGIIATLTVKFEELDATLRAIYDAELAALRKALDDTTAAKALVEVKVS